MMDHLKVVGILALIVLFIWGTIQTGGVLFAGALACVFLGAVYIGLLAVVRGEV